MAKKFLTDEAKRALRSAIHAVEESSSAEVVITVRRQSDRYTHTHAGVATVLASAALAFLLFSPYNFSLWSVLVDPLIVGLVSYYCSTQIPSISRWLNSDQTLGRHVRSAAHAAFFEKGIRHTRERTGILVFISLVERRVEIVPDSGVIQAVPPVPWREAVCRINTAMQQHVDGVSVAEHVAKLGDLLRHVLPRSADDENELPDEVCGHL